MNFTSLKKMLLEQSLDIKESERSEGGDGVAVDQSSAIVLKNVLFLLSLMFRYPDEKIYSELKTKIKNFRGFFKEYGGDIPPFPDLEALQAEYIRLFVNNQGFVPAAPYASCYLDDGLLMGASLFNIREMMLDSGFVLDESARELEDHVAILLEFCAGLVSALIEGKKSGKDNVTAKICSLMQVTYGYIKPMADSFAADINSHAYHDFYITAGNMLASLISDADAVYARLLGFSQGMSDKKG